MRSGLVLLPSDVDRSIRPARDAGQLRQRPRNRVILTAGLIEKPLTIQGVGRGPEWRRELGTGSIQALTG